MKGRKNYCLIFLLILQSIVLNIQGQSVSTKLLFNYITSEEGLPNNKVNSIGMDAYGFIWIATNDGMCRFDGLEVKKYELSDYSIPVDQVRTSKVNRVLINDKGEIFIGAYSLFYYNKFVDKFEKYPFKNTSTLKRIRSLVQDSKNRIWIGDQTGLYSVDPYAKDSLISYPFTQPKTIDIESILPLGDSLLIGTKRHGVLIFDIIAKRFHTFSLFKDKDDKNVALSFYKDEDDKIWMGSKNNGIFQFDLEKQTVNHIYLVSNSDFSCRIRDFVKDDLGNLWIATRGGLFKKNAFSEEIVLSANTYDPYSKLLSNSVYDIFIDKNQGIWLGTYAGGVNYADLSRNPFSHFSAKEKNKYFLSHNIVSCFCEDNNGDIYIGTEGGLNFLDRKREEFTYYNHDNKDPNSLSEDAIKSIVCEDSGNLWIGTSVGGLNYFDQKTKKFKVFLSDSKNDKSLINNYINALALDEEQNLWIATDAGIDMLAYGENDFKHIYDGDVTLLYQNNGRLWAGMSGDGLYQFNAQSNTFEQYFQEQFLESSLQTMLIDSENNLWVGGNRGLMYVNTSDSSRYYYTTSNGLQTNLIMGIEEDEHKNIWVSTTSGLLKCENAVENYDSLIFKTYSLSEGIQNNQFSPNSHLKSSSSELFFGGVNGFTVFNPDEIKENTIPPQLSLTGLKISNRVVEVGQEIEGTVVLNKPVCEAPQINLNYKHLVVTFDFVAMHYSNPKQNKYRYKLMPLEKDWNYTSADRSDATYANLKGGTYTFIVEAANSDGFWSDSQLNLSVIVSPPFWKKLWFIALVLFLFVVAIVSFYLYRIASLKRHSSALEREVLERTEELYKNKTQIEEDYQSFKVLSEFGKKITSTLNKKNILDMVVDYVNVFVKVDYLGVGIVNMTKGRIEYPHVLINNKDYKPFVISFDDETQCAVQCLNKQMPIHCNKFESDIPEFLGTDQDMSTSLKGSLLCIPLTVENEKIGILTIFNDKQNSFNENHMTLLQTLSYYVAIALSNSNTYVALSKQTEVLSDVNSELIKRQKFIATQQVELVKQKEALLDLNVMKDKFFSIIAHDLKSPFQALLGFTELMESDFYNLDEDKKFTYIKYISQSAKNIFGLLTNLLTWSRAQTSNIKTDPMELDLVELIEEVLELLKNTYQKKSITIQNKVYSSVKVLADRNMIETILRNLISNAIKFTQVKGEIVIDAIPTDTMVQISIKDTGVGMTESDVRTLFSIDKTVSRSGTLGESGTGLGLLICKEFILKNEGKIWVESNLEHGSTFYFTLKMVSKSSAITSN